MGWWGRKSLSSGVVNGGFQQWSDGGESDKPVNKSTKLAA